MLTSSDVVELYTAILGRPPETEQRVANKIAKHSSRESLSDELTRSEEFRSRVAPLIAAYKRTDGYQAIYRFPSLAGQNSRSCEDRCIAIENHLRNELECKDLRHLRILDVGCAQGYNSLYFAARGAKVFGTDILQQNIDFCSLLAKTTRLNAVSFKKEAFSDDTIRFAIDTGINVVFLLSVLHHVITAKGLGWNARALSRLLENKITIVAELAHKREDVTFAWKEHLPENELAVFGDCSYEAVRIGDFNALNGNAIRPLYAIQQNEIRYRPLNPNILYSAVVGPARTIKHSRITFSGVTIAPVPQKQYANTDDKFIKIFRLGAAHLVSRALFAELVIGQRLAEIGVAPPIEGTCTGDGYFCIVYQRIPGVDLATYIQSQPIRLRRQCAIRIVQKFQLIRELGLYWNDCRHHNILIDEQGQPFLIDFELSSFVQVEDNLRRLKWTMWHLCHSDHGGLIPEASLPTDKLPDVPVFQEKGCDEWLKITQLLSSEPRPETVGFAPHPVSDISVGQPEAPHSGSP
jgi:2-polyprenyl-3-methyl-5-hydroxy-6-metoxy-1,4-benzoquinol methylase